MKKFALTLLFIALLLGASTKVSQADPPPRYKLTTVSWVLTTRNKLDVDDSYVVLIGQVTKRIGDETYWFSDGTGSVRLDSAKFELPVGKRVLIGGRVDQAFLGFGSLEIDVRRWNPLN